LPDPSDARSARLEPYHIENGLDPGYTETLLWGVPLKSLDRSRVETNAKDLVLAWNTDGKYHRVLFFDQKPETGSA